MRVYYCDGCGKRVSEADLEAGQGVVTDDACFCADCTPGSAGDSDQVASLDEAVGVLDEDLEAPPAPMATPRTARRRPQPAAGGGGASAAIVIVVVLLAAAVFVFAYGFTLSRRKKEQAAASPQTIESFEVARPADIKPIAVQPAPQPEPTPSLPDGRRPLGEDMPTPDIVVAPRPVPAQPAPKPEPAAPKTTAPEPSFTPAAPGEGWTSVFDGQQLGDWRAIGGSGYVENGALVTTQSADLYYSADWAEFTLKCELKAENPEDQRLLGLGLATPKTGRGSPRVSAMFHTDGDIHVRVGANRWRSGGGAVDLGSWTPMTFKLTRNTLEIYRDEELIGNVDVSSIPVEKGGLYFYSYKGATARMRNPQVKVISR